MSSKKRSVMAYHEAGHAVIARVLGVGVAYVALFSTDDDNRAAAPTLSAAWSVRGGDLLSRLAAYETDAKVMLACPHAQQKFYPVKNAKKAVANEWSGDIENARSCAGMIVLFRDGGELDDAPTAVTLSERQLDEVNRLIDQWWKESATLVEKNWSAIRRVAEALLSRPLLNQDDVDALIAEER